MLLILALLFHSQHHWFTPVGCSRMSHHRFLSLGSPEANSPRVSASPTYTCKHGLKQRWMGSLGVRGGLFRGPGEQEGPRHFLPPIYCQPHLPRMPFPGLAPTSSASDPLVPVAGRLPASRAPGDRQSLLRLSPLAARPIASSTHKSRNAGCLRDCFSGWCSTVRQQPANPASLKIYHSSAAACRPSGARPSGLSSAGHTSRPAQGSAWARDALAHVTTQSTCWPQRRSPGGRTFCLCH